MSSLKKFFSNLQQISPYVYGLSMVTFCMQLGATLVHGSGNKVVVGSIISASSFILLRNFGEASAFFWRVLAGYLSDQFQNRTIFLILGYGSAFILKICFFLSTLGMDKRISLGLFIFTHLTDRVANAIRDPTKEAFISDISNSELRSLSFSLRKGIGSFGTVLGGILGYCLFKGKIPSSIIYFIAIIPVFSASVILFFMFSTQNKLSFNYRTIFKKVLCLVFPFLFVAFLWSHGVVSNLPVISSLILSLFGLLFIASMVSIWEIFFLISVLFSCIIFHHPLLSYVMICFSIFFRRDFIIKDSIILVFSIIFSLNFDNFTWSSYLVLINCILSLLLKPYVFKNLFKDFSNFSPQKFIKEVFLISVVFCTAESFFIESLPIKIGAMISSVLFCGSFDSFIFKYIIYRVTEKSSLRERICSIFGYIFCKNFLLKNIFNAKIAGNFGNPLENIVLSIVSLIFIVGSFYLRSLLIRNLKNLFNFSLHFILNILLSSFLTIGFFYLISDNSKNNIYLVLALLIFFKVIFRCLYSNLLFQISYQDKRKDFHFIEYIIKNLIFDMSNLFLVFIHPNILFITIIFEFLYNYNLFFKRPNNILLCFSALYLFNVILNTAPMLKSLWNFKTSIPIIFISFFLCAILFILKNFIVRNSILIIISYIFGNTSVYYYLIKNKIFQPLNFSIEHSNSMLFLISLFLSLGIKFLLNKMEFMNIYLRRYFLISASIYCSSWIFGLSVSNLFLRNFFLISLLFFLFLSLQRIIFLVRNLEKIKEIFSQGDDTKKFQNLLVIFGMIITSRLNESIYFQQAINFGFSGEFICITLSIIYFFMTLSSFMIYKLESKLFQGGINKKLIYFLCSCLVLSNFFLMGNFPGNFSGNLSPKISFLIAIIFYGIYGGTFEIIVSTLISKCFSNRKLTGTVFGIYYFFSGLVLSFTGFLTSFLFKKYGVNACVTFCFFQSFILILRTYFKKF